MILRLQLFYGLIFLSTFFSWQMLRKYGWVPVLLLSWVLISALTNSYYPGYTFDTLSLRLRLVSARSFMLVVMLVYLMTWFTPWHIKKLVLFFEGLVAVNCFSYLHFGHGLFNAGSMDMAVMSMIYPMMLFRPQRYTALRCAVLMFPILCLLFKNTGSTVFFGLTVGIVSYMAVRRKWLWLIVSGAGIMSVGYWVAKIQEHPQGFFSDSGRFEPWKVIMGWWYENANFFVGTGTGTMQWLGPYIQDKQDGLLIFMHNEYLQVIFEQGAIGFILMLALIYLCLKKAIKYPWLFASCMSTLFVFVTQFPLRFFFSQIFVLLLVRLCLDNESRKFVEE